LVLLAVMLLLWDLPLLLLLLLLLLERFLWKPPRRRLLLLRRGGGWWRGSGGCLSRCVAHKVRHLREHLVGQAKFIGELFGPHLHSRN
jgi:hypothetical protein